MLRFSLVCAGLLAASSSVHASWADGLFDEALKDFGAVPHGTVAVHPFRLTNNTGVPIHIFSVRVSCGCTAARAIETSLAPGQETVVLAQMDTRRFYGTKSVTIYVQFDQPRFEEVRLQVQANSRDDLVFSRESLDFGKIKRGTTAKADMTVSFVGGGLTQVKEVSSDSNYLLPEVREIRRDNGEVVYQVLAKIRTDTPPGKWYSDIWLKTNNPITPRVRVPVAIDIEASLSVNPRTIALGQVKAGTESERKVILRAAQPFRITKIDGADAQVRIQEADAEPKAVHVLTVTLHPSAPGALSRTVRVRTDLQTGGDIEFNAQAVVLP
jgi:hypothetical protein